jgi:Ca2+-transporting ATPase
MHTKPTMTGLSRTEAETRLAAEGPNTLPGAQRRTLLRIVLEVIREPMFLLLIACGALYFSIGDRQEAAMLLGFVAVIIGITVVQERRTERALDALRDLSQPHAVVIRDGERLTISTTQVVRGDLVVLSEGQRVPADGSLVEGTSLAVDESLLTGESVPVRKVPQPSKATPMERPGGEDTPFVFGGTLVVRGQGVVEVSATALRTEMGRIGAALATLSPGRSHLQEETRRIVRVVAIGAVFLSIAVTLIYGLTRGAWSEGLLSGLATAMALLPEEFPVVLTVFLALGARRLSKEGVLTRRMPAIETLGSTTVLCCDKTGTLTQNRMVVRALWSPQGSWMAGNTTALPEEVHGVVENGILASPVDPIDPMEVALHTLGKTTLQETEHLHPDWALRREYPLTPELLAMTRAWSTPEGKPCHRVSAKGAPEAIFDLCHLNDHDMAEYAAEAQALAGRGLRVLGVAHADHHSDSLPAIQHDFEFTFDGLVAFEDPLRDEVPEAIAQCHRAGVRVMMITGDYPGTALAIARVAGLPESVPIRGSEIASMDDDALSKRLAATHVAARIVPEDKLRIVQRLQAAGEIVTMTGDGVNDAPALMAADIGVAMGQRGTEVAREAADVVLVNDDFGSLVVAIADGRRIFANLQKSMAYILAIHVPMAGLAIIPAVAGWSAALLPVHIVMLELIIDPACSLVFEAEPAEPGNMDRPPRARDASMIDRRILVGSVLQGLVVLAVTLGVFGWASTLFPDSPDSVRSLTFMTLMVSNVGLILANRSWERSAWTVLKSYNPVFPWISGGALVLVVAITYVPGLNGILHFVAVPAALTGVAVLAGLGSLLLVEGLKVLGRRLL